MFKKAIEFITEYQSIIGVILGTLLGFLIGIIFYDWYIYRNQISGKDITKRYLQSMTHDQVLTLEKQAREELLNDQLIEKEIKDRLNDLDFN